MCAHRHHQLILVVAVMVCKLLPANGLPASTLNFLSSGNIPAPSGGDQTGSFQSSVPGHQSQPPPLPHNILITLIKWYPLPSIRVTWSYTPPEEGPPCEAFRIIYHPINSRYRYIVEVPCNVFNVTLEHLLPSTEYVLTVNPNPMPPAAAAALASHEYGHPARRNDGSPGWAINCIRFISPHTEFNRFSRVKSTSLIIRKSPNEENQGIVVVKVGELMVVLFVLFGWFLIIFLFIKKWGKIRGIETTASFPTAAITAALPGFPNGPGSNTALSSAHPSFRGQRSEDTTTIGRLHMNDAMSLFLYGDRRTSCFTFDNDAAAAERRRTNEARKYKSAENLFVDYTVTSLTKLTHTLSPPTFGPFPPIHKSADT